MAVTAGNYLKAFIWALVGSLILGVILFPYGGSTGTGGLAFAIWHTIGVLVVALILWFYPTERPPFFKTFLGTTGPESTTLFVLTVEAAFVGLWIGFLLLTAVIAFLGWWTGVVGSAWGAAHFVVSALILMYAWHQSRKKDDPAGWYIAPVAICLALFLVPLAYEGVLFG
jgi:hypothetical protein